MYITGDLASKDTVASAFDKAKPNGIINVASPDALTPDEAVFWRCNVTSVQNIIECRQERGIRVLVHTSSSEVVQEGYKDICYATEDWPVLDSPVHGSVYANTKAIGEGIVLRANSEKSLLTTAIRGKTLFGEGDVVITRYFIELARSGKIRFQVGPGTNMYDFIYSRNCAEGHIQAAMALLYAAHSTKPIPEGKRVDGEAFNISNGDPRPFWSIPRIVFNASGYSIEEKDNWKIPLGPVLFFMAIWAWIFWFATFGETPAITRNM